MFEMVFRKSFVKSKQFKKFYRVYGNAVNDYREVQMRAFRIAGFAGEPYHFPPLHYVARFHLKFREVQIKSHEAETVVYDNSLAVIPEGARHAHYAAIPGQD